MGKFSAGFWIIGLAIYFTIFYVVVFSLVVSSTDYTLMRGTEDLSAKYVSLEGFTGTASGKCTGTSYASISCGYLGITDNTTCIMVNGCTWTGTKCEGIPQYMNCDSPNVHYNNTLCQIMKCTWISYEAPRQISASDSFDWSSTISAFVAMTGFSGDLGVPTGFRFFVHVFIFWIPFFILIWAIYMALPWIH